MQCISPTPKSEQTDDRLPSTLSPISLEDQILLLSTRIYLGQDELKSIHVLLHESTSLDWNRLTSKARYNGLIPILYQLLKQALQYGGSVDIPKETLDVLKGHVRVMACFSQCLFQELATLTQVFQSTNIDLLTFKGPTLALAVYGDLSLRQPGDLDFLVASESFEKASQLLQIQGYELRAEHAWAKCLRRNLTQIEIDLHQNVAGIYLPFQLDFQGIWSRREQTEIAGMTFNHPAPEDLLVLLCVQFAKDAHGKQYKFIKVCDIAAVINRSSLDWSLVLDIAHRCEGDRPLKLGLLMVEMLFDIELPSDIQTYIDSDWVIEQYCRCIGQELLSDSSTHRSIPDLMWRALFLFQHPRLKWQYNQRLAKLFMHSIVNKARTKFC